MTLRRKPRPDPVEDQPQPMERPTVRPVGSFRMATAADIALRRAPAPEHKPPPKPAPRTHTEEESAYLGAVKSIGCVLCARLGLNQEHPTHAHHIRTGYGAQERAPDWLTVALCWLCHQGDNGIHGDQALLRQAKCTELDLLNDTIRDVRRSER